MIQNNSTTHTVIFNQAIANYPEFWQNKKPKLKKLIHDLQNEIMILENSEFISTKSQSILALWSISGSGSLTDDFIDTPSDEKYKNQKIYAGSDKKRLRFAENVILKIAEVRAKKRARTFVQKVDIIQKYGPILIYNGVGQQVKTLKENSGKTYAVSPEKIFVPSGKIVKTLDQIINFGRPTELKDKKGILLLVSHAPHLVRVLRFMKKYERNFEGLKIIPLAIPTKSPKLFIKAEVIGVCDYIARGDADFKPISKIK